MNQQLVAQTDARPIDRRGFLARLGLGAAAVAAASLPLGAQEPASNGAANLPMQQEAYKPVRLPAKAGAAPQLTKDERDALERRIACQCGCTLDVFTCRTTDFSCRVSPAMHSDVMALVAGGYSAQEIVDAFTDTYGEQVLMAPKREGFNLVGYGAPFVVMAVAGTGVAVLLRRWRRGAGGERAPVAAPDDVKIDASADELARLDAAVRGDDR